MNNCNPFGLKNAESKYSKFWYDRLFDWAMSVYHFTGPEFDSGDLDERYLNMILLTRGYAAFFRDGGGKLRATECAISGTDWYHRPTRITVNKSDSDNHNINRTFTPGKDAVLMWNDRFRRPAIDVIRYYASLLGRMQTSLRVNAANVRMTKIFTAADDPQAQQIRRMIDDVEKGTHAVVLKSNVMQELITNGNKQPPFYAAPSDYLIDKFLADTRNVLDEFFAVFGVNSSGANMQKGERNLVDEVHSNDAQVDIALANYLDPRKMAIDEVNRLFGVNLNIEVRGGSDYAQSIEGSSDPAD